METTSPKPFVFVVMPFKEDFRDLYELGIKQACQDAGAYCERVDEQLFHENILQRIKNQIAKADVIIAEMTDQNPNVFYEVGYAHALNKPVILITRDAGDIPFDLKVYPHIIHHGKIINLKAQLQAKVEWCISNLPNKPANYKPDTGKVDFAYYIQNTELVNNPEIILESSFVDDGDGWMWLCEITIHIHNKSQKPVDLTKNRILLVTPKDYDVSHPDFREKIELPDGRNMFELYFSKTLLPNDWGAKSIVVSLPSGPEVETPLRPDMKLQVNQVSGSTEYPFRLNIAHPQPKRSIEMSDRDIPF